MADPEFEQRVQRLIRLHGAADRGHIAAITADGRVVLRIRRSTRLPWRGLAGALLILLAGKAALLAEIGADAYAAELAALRGGPAGEAAAWIAAPGPATLWLAERIGG